MMHIPTATNTLDQPVVIMGDIHGCDTALNRLLDLVESAVKGHPRPLLVTLGDHINRGLQSCEVIDTLLSPRVQDRFHLRSLGGNHEQMMLASCAHNAEKGDWLKHGGAETLESYGISMTMSPSAAIRAFKAVMPPEHRAFWGRLEAPFELPPHALGRPGLILIHATIDTRRPWDARAQQEAVWGNPKHLGLKDGHGRWIIHGHYATRSRDVEIFPNRMNLDTGAGFLDGKLSAAVLDPDGSLQTFSVPIL